MHPGLKHTRMLMPDNSRPPVHVGLFCSLREQYNEFTLIMMIQLLASSELVIHPLRLAQRCTPRNICIFVVEFLYNQTSESRNVFAPGIRIPQQGRGR